MIRITFFDNVTNVLPFKAQIWDLINLCDKDFFPALSYREMRLNGPVNYFEELFVENAKFLLAFLEEQVVGFSVFFHNHFEDLIAPHAPCNYIKIACIHSDYRGLRIASSFNQFIEEQLPENVTLSYIARRTWSTKLLSRFGYDLMHQFDNDRGNEISTVYFAKFMQAPILHKEA